MFNLIKKWLLLTGAIYLAALACGNIAFENGLVTIVILALLITIGQLLSRLVQESVLAPINKITLGIAGFIVDALAISLVTFLFRQVGFTAFDSGRWLQLVSFLPQTQLAGFWSLLPFSAIITAISRILISQK